MVKSTSKDAQDLFRSLHSAYSATPTNLKVSQSPFPSLFAHPLWNLFSFCRSSTCMSFSPSSLLWFRYAYRWLLDLRFSSRSVVIFQVLNVNQFVFLRFEPVIRCCRIGVLTYISKKKCAYETYNFELQCSLCKWGCSIQAPVSCFGFNLNDMVNLFCVFQKIQDDSNK